MEVVLPWRVLDRVRCEDVRAVIHIDLLILIDIRVNHGIVVDGYADDGLVDVVEKIADHGLLGVHGLLLLQHRVRVHALMRCFVDALVMTLQV